MKNNVKPGFHMLNEIFEQPRTVQNAVAGRVDPVSGTVQLQFPMTDAEIGSLSGIRIAASGTSRYAGLYAKYVIESLAGIPVDVEYASEYVNRRTRRPTPPVTIVTSQSGETSDTLAALRQARREGSRTLAICNVENSSMMREADAALDIRGGPELSVPSTKAFGGQLTCFLLLALYLARVRGLTPATLLSTLARELFHLPDKMCAALRLDDRCSQIAARYSHIPDFIFFGSGPHYPIALDGALKLKEAAYIHSEGYPIGEFKHGQVTLIDDQVIVIFAMMHNPYDGESKGRRDAALQYMKEIKTLAGHVIALLTEGDLATAQLADEALCLPTTPDLLAPLLEIIPLELLAYHVALCRGLDPDKPRNLAKVVRAQAATGVRGGED